MASQLAGCMSGPVYNQFFAGAPDTSEINESCPMKYNARC